MSVIAHDFPGLLATDAPGRLFRRGPRRRLRSSELKQQSRAVRAAVTALAPAEREAIETAFFSEMTYAETAARLKQPVGTVKTRIRAALHKLRRALAGKAGKR